MPIQPSPFKLPSGTRGVRADCTGTISQEDAETWLRQVDRGGAFHGVPILAVALEIDHVTAEARGVFSRRGDSPGRPDVWMAVVVTNPVIRVTTNFVMRLTGNRKMRLFANEGTALRWLDERAREAAGAAPA
jgi:hypothetical protein